MKKLWLFVAAIAMVSCKNEPLDYALVSGKIANATAKEITLYGTTDRKFKKTIKLAEDGSFNDTLKIEAGEFMLVEARNLTPLHLNVGHNISIDYDANDFKNTVKITGEGSGISNYLIAKNAKETELMGPGTDVFTKEEADYKTVMNSIKTAQEGLLMSVEGIPAGYKTAEKRNLNYAYLGKLSMYGMYHAYYAKKPDFKPSDDFLKEVDALDYNNEEDFKSSASYKSLVSSYYGNKASEMVENNKDMPRSMAMFKILGTVKSDAIKNSLAYDTAVNEITYTDKVEEFYNAFMEVSTDAKNNEEITKSYDILKGLTKGNPSPLFNDYENYAGGTTSLTDLKGKYVYVDVWATWCGPCLAEIPSLKKVEKEYHGKNIQFLSVSIDDIKDHGKWKDMIKEKELGGIQVFADNNWESAFVQGYLIKGIPRFIIIDPQGNIVTANAPRPSDPKLIDMFNELKI